MGKTNWDNELAEMGRKSLLKRSPIVQRVDEPMVTPIFPCGCDKPHKPGTSFFVSCIEDSDQQRKSLLLGPYATHTEALANVERGRKLAEENDPKAHWYSFGTCGIAEPTDRKGVFGK